MDSLDFSNKNFQLAAELIQYTQEFIFLTGKAGTGKTTFLKYIKDKCGKKYVLTAPTGVAAINAGGVTLHSFFQLPLGTFIAEYRKSWGSEDNHIVNRHQLLSKLRINSTKRKLIRELELLIIDEISMVRADTLDAVDLILRHIRNRELEPFGGVQLLFIGDLFQLPPVVRNDEMQIMSESYASPFFFDAHALSDQAPICIELDKIYRQDDDTFIRILNSIRNNDLDQDGYGLLTERYVPDFLPDGNSGVITLTSHNAQANEINHSELLKLNAPEVVLDAKVTGEFPESAFPIEPQLVLKIGAQVMFVKNDKGEHRRYYNGKIGTVNRINMAKNEIEIYFPKEKNSITIQPEKWDNIRYKLNDTNNKIEEDVIGTFEQFPFRLAWAVTIHKSQGLTFEEAVIDAGKSFVAGQVYVALSRLTSLKGMVLRSRITPQSVITDPRIIEYMNRKKDAALWDSKLEIGKSEFLKDLFIRTFSWSGFISRIQLYLEESIGILTQDIINSSDQYRSALLNWRQLEKVGRDFSYQVYTLYIDRDWAKLQNRIDAAHQWMRQQILDLTISIFEEWNKELKIQKGGAKASSAVQYMLRQAKLKVEDMNRVSIAIQVLSETEDIDKAINAYRESTIQKISIASSQEESKSKESGRKSETSAQISFDMFKNKMSIDEIAERRKLVRTTISGHLSEYIATGAIVPSDLMPIDKMYEILDVIKQNPTDRMVDIKQKLGDQFSYEEIKWTLAYYQHQQSLEART